MGCRCEGFYETTRSLNPSCPGKSAKRVFALDVPGIHVFLCSNGVDGRVKPGHDELLSDRISEADASCERANRPIDKFLSLAKVVI
jgi:hypothetical protein